MLENESMLREIRVAFSTYETYVKLSGKTAMLDTNKSAEGFLAELLNVTYGWSLRPVKRVNFPGLDLLDVDSKIGVQVSSDNSADKVNETLETIIQYDLRKHIDQLYFLFLKPKKDNYKLTVSCLGVRFDASTDVIDFAGLLSDVGTGTLGKIQNVHRVVMSYLPATFPKEISRLRKEREKIATGLATLDRAVFEQLEQYEHPYLMLKALGEIRTALQKQGAKFMGNKPLAREFTEICKVLQDCENAVGAAFPLLKDCVMKKRFPTAAEQQSGQLWQAMGRMMTIRGDIRRRRDAIAAELERIDLLLAA